MKGYSLELLSDLLLSIFRDTKELDRFLEYHGYGSAHIAINKTSAPSHVVFDLIKYLDRSGLIDKELFERLIDTYPAREKDITDIANELGLRINQPNEASLDPEVPTTSDLDPTITPPTNLSEEDKQFLELLDTHINDIGSENNVLMYLDTPYWAWTASSAVLGSFRPRDLKPLSLGTDSEDKRNALHYLVNAVEVRSDGDWVLKNEIREQALSKLLDNGVMDKAINTNQSLPDKHRDWLATITGHTPGGIPPLPEVSTQELRALYNVTLWIEKSNPSYLSRSSESIRVAMARRSLIDPLRSLAGKHFRGRKKELEKIRKLFKGNATAKTLVVWGAGGVGKSSLIGKIVVELELQGSESTPYAYIDFDKSENNPRNPRDLIDSILEQLRLLFFEKEETTHQLIGLESISKGSTAQFGTADALSELAELKDEHLIDRLANILDSAQSSNNKVPLILILDTFEEVQVQGPGVVEKVVELTRMFRKRIPDFRLLVSGRADIPEFNIGNSQNLQLSDLDNEAAYGVLSHFGVTSERLQKRIVENFGSNPLTLKLASEAIAKIGDDNLLSDLSTSDALASVAAEQIQGVLYKRILGHIDDPEVVKVAHPGLIVRRVTADILKNVLAEPCGLETTNFNKLFERLQREVSLFTRDGSGVLVHRRDVRKIMLLAMNDDPTHREKVAHIHKLAVQYYSENDDAGSRVEELYHRIMQNDHPRTLDALWSSEMKNSLASTLEEPISTGAMIWLKSRLGIVSETERIQLDLEDWEIEAYRRANSWLDSDDPHSALKVCEERSERLPGSQLHLIEIRAYIQLDQLKKGIIALEAYLSEAAEEGLREHQLELRLLSVKLFIKKQDKDELVAAVSAINNLAKLTNRPVDSLRAIVEAAEWLPKSGIENELVSELIKDWFNRAEDARLQENTELVTRAVALVGASTPEVIVRLAHVFGGQESLNVGVFSSDVFEMRRLLESTQLKENGMLQQLAEEVGIADQNWSIQKLAGEIFRKGLLGRTLIMALDHPGKNKSIGHQIVDTMLRELPTRKRS